jgi:enoyl-CoA hydratase/carnithine racemase
MTGSFQTLIFEKKDHIARVTLNRPEVLNVYNVQMRDDLYQVLGALEQDPEVKVTIFKGVGEKAFCAGADLTEFLTAPPPVIARQARWVRDVWGLFLRLPHPVVAAVHGYVLGSGMEIALCCDIVIASEDAQFGLPEVGLGIIPAAGGTQTLPRRIGLAKSIELLLSNRVIGANEAYEIGLVNRVVPREKLLETSWSIAKQIASCNPLAVRLAKEAMVRGFSMSLSQGMDLEKRLGARLRLHRSEGLADI